MWLLRVTRCAAQSTDLEQLHDSGLVGKDTCDYGNVTFVVFAAPQMHYLADLLEFYSSCADC